MNKPLRKLRPFLGSEDSGSAHVFSVYGVGFRVSADKAENAAVGAGDRPCAVSCGQSRFKFRFRMYYKVLEGPLPIAPQRFLIKLPR